MGVVDAEVTEEDEMFDGIRVLEGEGSLLEVTNEDVCDCIAIDVAVGGELDGLRGNARVGTREGEGELVRRECSRICGGCEGANL